MVGLLALSACGDSKSDNGDDQVAVATWHGGIQSLMIEHCGACHTSDGVGPFALDEYEAAKTVAFSALDAVQSNTMPPWLAHDTDECAPERPWQDDLRLSDEQKELLAQWVADDMPLGDPETALPIPELPTLGLENPSIEVSFRQPFAVSGEKDLFECFVMDPEVTEETWITGVQIKAGNDKVDHHALVFLDVNGESEELATDGHFPCFSNPDIDGSLIGAWAPGALPFTIPEGGGIPMPAGSRIVVQMHYHPTAMGTEMDVSTVELSTTDEQPEYEAVLALLGNFGKQEEDGSGLQDGMNDVDGPEFRIPAGESDHVETLVYRQELPIDVPIFSVGAHMHYVGTSMKIEKRNSDGVVDECLLHTPRWDFDWQRSYSYDTAIEDLPVLGGNEELVMRCNYNNSMSNPAVVDALTEQGLTQPVDVYLGDETLDEMCLGVFGVLLPPGLI
jgi:mono/diheme cytochrome c family protein